MPYGRRTGGETEPPRNQVRRRSPFHDRQVDLGAAFFDPEGWAGVSWYERGVAGADAYDFPDGERLRR